MDRSLPEPLAHLHGWARARPSLRRFTLANRLLLAMAFFPTGLVKLTGERFTAMGVDTPIGFFFEAMYQTGPYWRFIGLAQVAAAVLLLVPWTTTFGALLFLPIALSIVLITWGVGFGSTVVVAAGMLLSVTYLLCWDADRIWAAAAGLWGRSPTGPLLEGAHWIESTGWLLGGLVGMALLLTTRAFLPISWRLPLLTLGAAAAALVLCGWVVGARLRTS